MSIREIARKEFRARRFSTVALFCLLWLALIVAAALLPRDYSSRATLQLDTTLAGADALAQRLSERFAAGNGGPDRVEVTHRGGEMDIRYTARSAAAALAGLDGLLATITAEELERARAALRATETALLEQVRAAEARVGQAERQLGAAMAELPEGGESALGARIGQLQGELDALESDIAASVAQRRSLESLLDQVRRQIESLAPLAEGLASREAAMREAQERLAAQRAAASPDVARTAELEAGVAGLQTGLDAATAEGAGARARIDAELLPEQRRLQARLATAGEELSAKRKRRAAISARLEQLRTETSSVQQGSQAIREKQRDYDDAVALNRQLNVRLQEVRLDLGSHGGVAAALAFVTLRVPVLPEHPDGAPAWMVVLGTLLVAAAATLLRLLSAILVDDRIRLPETVIREAEVPVLAVIRDYRPLKAMGDVRWVVVGVALLVIVTLAANLLFLVLVG